MIDGEDVRYFALIVVGTAFALVVTALAAFIIGLLAGLIVFGFRLAAGI